MTSTVSDLQQALALHRAGRLVEAAAAYRRVLHDAPGDPEALGFFGLLCHQRGDTRQALSLLRRAVAQSPQTAAFHMHLGLALEGARDPEAALEAYREAARLEPEAADAPFNQGLVLLRLGRPEQAEGCFRRTLDLAPGDAEAALNLGRALAGQRRWRRAHDAFDHALSLRPDWVAALNGQGSALRRMGCHTEALAAYRLALVQAPGDARLHNNLGTVLNELGRRFEARSSFEHALRLNERLPEAHLNLGRLRRDTGDLDGALRACRRALALAPEFAGARPALASMLQDQVPPRFDPGLAAELLGLMHAPDVDPQDLARSAANQVRMRHRLPPRAVYEAGDGPLPVAALARDRLLRALLERTVNVDPDLEAALVALRRALLPGDAAGPEKRPRTGRGPVREEGRREGAQTGSEALRETGPEPGTGGRGPEAAPGAWTDADRLRAALALQCFANEYLFETSEAERARLARLEEALAAPAPAAPGGSSGHWRRDLLCLAMYRPLWTLEAVQGLGAGELSSFPGDLVRVIERTLLEPREERRLAPRIRSADPVRDPVSRRVRAQYETGPYPRWLGIAAVERSPVMESLARRFSPWTPACSLGPGSRALVLGCGSGYEPVELALREPRVTVIAVDLSLASLAYATRMAGKLGIGNVRFLHGDLLELGAVEGSFPLVSATGVLHHLRDPVAGWRAAAAKLEEGGLMRVGLYSAAARRSIVQARDVIRHRGIPATPDALRRFRLSLLRGELGPSLRRLARSPDLHSLSGLRDLLFHVEEHHFDLGRIAEALSSLGLRFVGFEHERPGTGLAYARMFPDDRGQTSLANWAAFEAEHPETFVGMYQFWCEKRAGPDAPSEAQAAPGSGRL